MTPLLLSKRQAAKMLGVDRGSTLEWLLDEGHIKTVIVGSMVRIPLDEVTRFASTGCAPELPIRRRRKLRARPPTAAEILAELDAK